MKTSPHMTINRRSESTAVQIPVGCLLLEGELNVPEEAKGLVLFAHGSGSGRRSPRNRFVAGELSRAGFGTLLFDLLTRREETDDRTDLRFDIPLLADRLQAATAWARTQPSTQNLPIGYFGASTGAAAALVAAERFGQGVAAVVSRGGRPDLAAEALGGVQSATLLIVGGDDLDVLALNRRALAEMVCVKALEVVDGATHLFVEPGALERVAELAREWFDLHLTAPSRSL